MAFRKLYINVRYTKSQFIKYLKKYNRYSGDLQKDIKDLDVFINMFLKLKYNGKIERMHIGIRDSEITSFNIFYILSVEDEIITYKDIRKFAKTLQEVLEVDLDRIDIIYGKDDKLTPFEDLGTFDELKYDDFN